jgi:hypothetical protein
MRNDKLGRYIEEPVAESHGPKSIPYQIELFEKNLNRLQEIVAQLEGRLSPLMRPTDESKCKPAPEPTGSYSPLSKHLSSLNTTLEYAISVLQAGITALERAGIRDHRIAALKEAIKRLEGQ